MILLIIIVFMHFIFVWYKHTPTSNVLAVPAYAPKKRFPKKRPLYLPHDNAIFYL
ncbi:MAG: hypothetical protein RJA25_1089 [Bacteroidota bacterium]|jgi:hypothetical protein